MDDILEQVRTFVEGEIDFKGQSLTEFLTTALLCVSGVIAFFAGYVTQNIYNTLYVGLAGTGLTFLAVVPAWPVYNQNPLKWLPARTGRNAGLQGVNLGVSGK